MNISITIEGPDWASVRQQMLDMTRAEPPRLKPAATPSVREVLDTIRREDDARSGVSPPMRGSGPEPDPEEERVDTDAEGEDETGDPTPPPPVKRGRPRKTAQSPQEPAGEPKAEAGPQAPADTLSSNPAALIEMRARTLAELQAAYANGKQKEVFALLSEHGKGAKSFRELTLEDFPPLRQAIDAGALA